MRYSSLKLSGMYGTWLHGFTCQQHLSTNGMSHPAFTLQPQCLTTLWPVLITRPAEGRRLSWPAWLVTY